MPDFHNRRKCNKCTCTKTGFLRCTKKNCPKKDKTLKLFRGIRIPRKHRLRPLREKTVRPPKRTEGQSQATFLDSSAEDVSGTSRPRRPLQEKTVRPPMDRSAEEHRGTNRPQRLSKNLKEFDKAFLDGEKCEPGVVYRSTDPPNVDTPGSSYRVDCNTCLCLANGNLHCGQMLCPSHDDVHRVKAKALLGQPCDDLDIIDKNLECVLCQCVHGTNVCHAKPNCEPSKKLEPIEEHLGKECTPGMIYK
ncbi:uncharacterized protein LOC134751266 [Cydia strobilella]|uniref:uncharacterized protein LOC134751266 n=1 Tax=Cydia strobilella TaxID=1100964 RepID=UPI0030049B33